MIVTSPNSTNEISAGGGQRVRRVALALDAVMGPRLSGKVLSGGGCPYHTDGLNGVRVRPQASREGTAMEYFAAIDVSLELSSVCVVDSSGRIVSERKVASEPEVLP